MRRLHHAYLAPPGASPQAAPEPDKAHSRGKWVGQGSPTPVGLAGCHARSACTAAQQRQTNKPLWTILSVRDALV